MKIVFMGTPDFAVPVFKRIISDGHEVGYAVTQPDRAGNHGKVIFSPVKQAAIDAGIPVLQPDRVSSDEESLSLIKAFEPDVIIVVAYGQILKSSILEIPKYGCFNVHASLLPRLRGASPIQHAILEGDERAGVTIMKVDEGLDTGDMLLSDSVEIGRMNFEELHDELSKLGADLMSRALVLIENGEAEFTKQNDEESTYAGMITKQDGKIDFSKSAEEIDRQVRAFDPWPGSFCDFDGKIMKIWKAEPVDTVSSTLSGTIIKVDTDSFLVACGSGCLKVTEIQMPGKKRTSVKDFLLGHAISTGDVLK